MSRKILLPIHPEHVKNILNGSKTCEYRKVVAKKDVSSILIYETAPVKRIVAEAEITDVLVLPPDELWLATRSGSGISREFFDRYFHNRSLACAYKLGRVTAFDVPRALKDYGVKTAPQSFVYVHAL